MESKITRLYQILQKLIGLHRQMLESVRLERTALLDANLKAIQETTYAKEAAIEAIMALESERIKLIGDLAVMFRKPIKDMTLQNLILEIQGRDLKQADQFRSALVALTALIDRIREQNEGNRGLVERSLHHVGEMKKNVLGEAAPNSQTYTQQGQKSHGSGSSRLLSKEA